MSILKIASLVVTPNAYEEGKLFSVIPSNGTGDLDVVRASTKTRVNSQGFISDTCKNLLSYSSNLSNAVWEKFTTIVTFNAGTSPDGLNNAVKIARGGATDIFLQTYNPEKVPNHVRSVWAKTVSGTGFTNLLSYNSNVNSLFFITNEWQRFEINSYNTSGNTSLYVVDFRAPGNTLTEILVWAPQAEVGPLATSFLSTTDRLNIPSIDYTGGGCPSILLEPQRTNLITYSQDASNSNWVKTAAIIVSNTTNAPDNTLTAFKLVGDSSGNVIHSIRQSPTFTPNTFPVITLHAKFSDLQYVYVGGLGRNPNNLEGYVWFDLQNGTVGTALSGYSGSMVPLVNGWFKITVFCPISTVSANREARVGVSDQNGNQNYTGDDVKGVFIWGIQLEQGSYATSYIPTQASAVTRLQDQLSKTGISNLIGQTEGVFFIESAALVTNDNIRAVTLTDGTTSNRIQIRYENSNNSIFFVFQSNGGFVTVIARTVVDITQFLKIAIRYSLSEVSIFINGAKAVTNNAIVLPLNLNKLSFDSGAGVLQFNAKVNSLILFKSYLSDDEMQLLGTTSYNTYQEMATALNYVTQ